MVRSFQSTMEHNQEWTPFEIKSLLLSKKYLIFSAMLICMLAAGIYSFFSPKRYQTSAVLQAAAIRGEVLDSNILITQVINSEGFLSSLSKRMNLNVPLKEMKRWIHADCDPQLSRDLVGVRLTLPKPDMAESIANGIVSYWHDLKKKSFQRRMDLYLKDYERLSSQTKGLEKDILRHREVLEFLQKDVIHNAAMIVLMETQLNASDSKRTNLSKELKDMDLTLFSEEGTHEMRILSPPVNPAEPYGPGIRRNMLAAAFLGLVLGCILVLFAAFFERGKRSLEKEQAAVLST